jgi:molybdopterin converting factor subunit 1
MMLRIRLFAHMAQRAGRQTLSLEAPEGTTLGEVAALLRRELPEMPWPTSTLLAVNQEYVPASHPLRANDEIAVIPPVSGGCGMLPGTPSQRNA